jgi:hypothetical protein
MALSKFKAIKLRSIPPAPQPLNGLFDGFLVGLALNVDVDRFYDLEPSVQHSTLIRMQGPLNDHGVLLFLP